MSRQANKSDKRRHVDESFNPLHRSTQVGAPGIGSVIAGMQACMAALPSLPYKSSALTDATLFGRLFLFFLQQPHEMRHAAVVLALGRLRGGLVLPMPSSEPIKNHVHSID
jgi:hypothetical protein